MDEKSEDRVEYGTGSSTRFGYIAEWRLKPESAVLSGFVFARDITEKWAQAPYRIGNLGRRDADIARQVVQPCIGPYDDDYSRHGLIGYDVAFAVIACLKTSIESKPLRHIEWRIVRIRLKESHEMERCDDDKERENHVNEISDILNEYRSE